MSQWMLQQVPESCLTGGLVVKYLFILPFPIILRRKVHLRMASSKRMRRA